MGNQKGDIDGNTNAGVQDIFLVKFNPSGVKQWIRLLGSSSHDYSRGIAIDSRDNIYLTGFTKGSIDGNSFAGSNDVFFVKYNSSGVKQ